MSQLDNRVRSILRRLDIAPSAAVAGHASLVVLDGGLPDYAPSAEVIEAAQAEARSAPPGCLIICGGLPLEGDANPAVSAEFPNALLEGDAC